MISMEQQLQALTTTVQTLQRKVNGLYELDRNIARHNQNTKASVPKLDSNYEELFNIPSTQKAMQRTAEPLTHREKQILNYVADGNTNKQIAHVLGNSDQTVKNQISAILYKLKANDRTHAVVLAIRHGWISAEEKNQGM